MSLNLHLTVKMFGRDVRIDLYQTPSRIAEHGMDNAEYRRRYMKWVHEEVLPAVDPAFYSKDAPSRERVLEHVRTVEFYCDHAAHEWSYW